MAQKKETAAKKMMTPSEYLKRPYGRVVMPDTDGSFIGEIVEFPGCVATGETATEALQSLERVAAGWLEIALEKGQKIPDPINVGSFSGITSVRLGKSLHRKAALGASRENVSLNQFIVTSVAERVGEIQSFRQSSNYFVIQHISATSDKGAVVLNPSSDAKHTLFLPMN
ncbi:MAG: type II toxin-antitoxin system HicB family antitoxin [Hyphomicrobium sp.]